MITKGKHLAYDIEENIAYIIRAGVVTAELVADLLGVGLLALDK